MEQQSARLPLDHAGGAELTQYSGTVLSITQKDLRNLDIHNASELHTVTFDSPILGERHVRVSGVPNLQLIEQTITPGFNQSLFLHLNFDAFPHGLTVTGNIQYLDACWPVESGSSAVKTLCADADELLLSDRCWQRVVFFDLQQGDFSELKDLTAYDLLIITGDFTDRSCEGFEYTLPADLLLVHTQGLNKLVIHRGTRIQVCNAPDLMQVVFQQVIPPGALPIQVFEAHSCPNLFRLVAGDGACNSKTRVSLKYCKQHTLQVSGELAKLHLTRCAFRKVVFETLSKLYVCNCYKLRTLEGNPLPAIYADGQTTREIVDSAARSFNERVFKHDINELSGPDDPLLKEMIAQAVTQYQPKTVSYALHVLHTAWRLGVDIKEIYRARCKLHYNHLRKQWVNLANELETDSKTKLRNWRWEMKADAYLESMRLDFELIAAAYCAQLPDTHRIPVHIVEGVVEHKMSLNVLLHLLLHDKAGVGPVFWAPILKRLSRRVRSEQPDDLIRRLLYSIAYFGDKDGSQPERKKTWQECVDALIGICITTAQTEMLLKNADTLLRVNPGLTRTLLLKKARKIQRGSGNFFIDLDLGENREQEAQSLMRVALSGNRNSNELQGVS